MLAVIITKQSAAWRRGAATVYEIVITAALRVLHRERRQNIISPIISRAAYARRAIASRKPSQRVAWRIGAEKPREAESARRVINQARRICESDDGLPRRA